MTANTFSKNNLAIQAGIDRATCKRILANVEPDKQVTPGRPEYSLATFLTAAVEHRLANASNNDGSVDSPSDTSSLIAARVRIANANAEAKERQNAIARGEFCHITAALDVFTLAMVAMREVALGLPGKVADSLTAHCAEDRIQIYEILRREVYANLETLAAPATYVGTGVAFATAKSGGKSGGSVSSLAEDESRADEGDGDE